MENPSLGPAATFKHDHPPIENVNQLVAAASSAGQRIADKMTAVVGSWPFLITQSIILVTWICANIVLKKGWDPYPFILLNLVLSFQAAYTGPIVMMSQNRQAEKDRLTAEQDFNTNEKAEVEIRVLMEQLTHQAEQIQGLSQQLSELTALLRSAASEPSAPH